MKYLRCLFCALALILLAGCAGIEIPTADAEVETVDQEAIDREMAEIEAAKKEAKEKVREEQTKKADEEKNDEAGQAGSEETVKDKAAVSEPTKSAEPEVPAAPAYRFRNPKLLDQHYTKHGIGMGFGSAAEYEAAAARVVTNPNALHKTEAEDGDDVYYIPASNEFVVVSTDGYIRTYFLPDSGIKYYNKQ